MYGLVYVRRGAYPCDLASLARVPFRSEGRFVARFIEGAYPFVPRIGYGHPLRLASLAASPSLREGEYFLFEPSPRRWDRVRQLVSNSFLVQHRRRRQTVGPPGSIV